MIAERSDWVFRQRVGESLFIFYCSRCDAANITKRRSSSAEAFASTALMSGLSVLQQNCCLRVSVPPVVEDFHKETDTMDVWFDSGSSHMAVLEQRPELRWPADHLKAVTVHRAGLILLYAHLLWFEDSTL